jgi:hypothetical protein
MLTIALTAKISQQANMNRQNAVGFLARIAADTSSWIILLQHCLLSILGFT